MKRFATLLIAIAGTLASLSTSSFAQEKADSSRKYITDPHIIQDSRVNELILKQIMINEERKGRVQGYRVQIHFGTEKAKALEVKKKFDEDFDSIPSYLSYQQPYFKIRVGDLRTRLEAYKLQVGVKNEFPGAFIVQDEIESRVKP